MMKFFKLSTSKQQTKKEKQEGAVKPELVLAQWKDVTSGEMSLYLAEVCMCVVRRPYL
jgi:hypothetical protein